MVDMKALTDKINDSGMSFKAVAEKSGMLRETLYNRLKGLGEFKASEISSLQATLHLTTKERDEIFFKKNSELNSTKNQNKQERKEKWNQNRLNQKNLVL